METKKKKCGRDYLKEKFAKLESDYAALQKKVEETQHEYETKVADLEKKKKEALATIEEKDAAYVRLKNEMKKTIESQGTTISKLTADKASMESDVKYYKQAAAEYWNAMGWFRRWLYEFATK